MKKETISQLSEIRATGEQGIIEAYLTKWNTVDSYDSTFKRGAFAQSFKERGPDNMRLLWNHDELAGKILEAREDNIGPWVRVQCNLNTEAGRKAFEHVKSGDVKAFSFGFRSEKDYMENGIRVIEKVDVLECGPVVFEANEQAKIQNVREEERAVKFKDTMKTNELNIRLGVIMESLYQTLDEIRWTANQKEWEPLSVTAIDGFRKAYVGWIQEFNASGQRSIPLKNELSECFYNEFAGDNLKDIASVTSFTVNELRRIASGDIVENKADKLIELSEDISEAHKRERKNRVEKLFDELRKGGFTSAERSRFIGLLEQTEPDDIENITSEIDKLIANITYK